VATRPADRPLSVEDLPLVGGRPCLDFVNTTGARARRPRERMHAPGDLVRWARRAGLLAPRAPHGREPGRADLTRALALREALYRALLAARAGRAPAARDVALVERALHRGLAGRRLAWVRGSVRWGGFPARGPGKYAMERLLGELAEDAVALLASPDLARVRKCDACDWLYLDGTKNRSRRFCKALCADRVRSRRWYARHRRKPAGRKET
jgi:predicted RNA-binding Zn ribbon-like protein